MEEKNKKRFIFCLIFNIAETIVILLLGLLINVDIHSIIMIMLTFFISRLIYGNPKHFKKWYKCLVWSTLIFLTLFMVVKLDFKISMCFTIFAALLLSGKADIQDIYLWKNNGEPSKYQDIIDFLEYHPLDDSIYEFEQKLQKNDSLLYLVYKYKFIDKLTFKDIGEKLNLSNPRIADMLDKIAFAMRINCKI